MRIVHALALITCAQALHAQALPPRKLEEQKAEHSPLSQLNAAELNYLITTLILYVEVIAIDIENELNKVKPAESEVEQMVHKRLTSRNIPLNGLNREQIDFLTQKRKIQQDALTAMKGKTQVEQQAIFDQMVTDLNAHLSTASDSVKPLLSGSEQLRALSELFQIDTHFNNIIAEANTKHTDPTQQALHLVTGLRALADKLRLTLR